MSQVQQNHPQSTSSQFVNQRVTHMYDTTARGTVRRWNDGERLVGVEWDERPNYIAPCIRDEVVFDSERDARKQRKQRKAREDRKPRYDEDDDYDY